MIKFNKLTETAIIPTRATKGSAGYDLYSMGAGITDGVAHIPTGISVDMSDGLAGFIWPRSSMAAKGVQVLGGLIDSDYKGEIIVLLYSRSGFTFKKGERIAQIVFSPVITGDDTPIAERDGGFGSTGK